MTSKQKSRRRWHTIKAYIERRQGRITVNELARRYRLAPSNVSRGLRQRKIHLEPLFPWERTKGGSLAKQALALYFLSLKPAQIEQKLPIKAETVTKYVLALTTLTAKGPPGGQQYRMFSEYAVESLRDALEKTYGLGDHFERVILSQGHDYFSVDPGQFLRELRRPCLETPEFLRRKLGRVLKTDNVRRVGNAIHILGRNGRLVKVPL